MNFTKRLLALFFAGIALVLLAVFCMVSYCSQHTFAMEVIYFAVPPMLVMLGIIFLGIWLAGKSDQRMGMNAPRQNAPKNEPHAFLADQGCDSGRLLELLKDAADNQRCMLKRIEDLANNRLAGNAEPPAGSGFAPVASGSAPDEEAAGRSRLLALNAANETARAHELMALYLSKSR
jgi:hypothetical protein